MCRGISHLEHRNSFRENFPLGLNLDFTFRLNIERLLKPVDRDFSTEKPWLMFVLFNQSPVLVLGGLSMGSDWSILLIRTSDWLWQWQCWGIESFYSWECHHLISTVAKEHLSSLPMRGQSCQISANQRAPVTPIRVRGPQYLIILAVGDRIGINQGIHSSPIITLGHIRQWSLIWHLVICFRYHTMLHLIRNVCSETENQ